MARASWPGGRRIGGTSRVVLLGLTCLLSAASTLRGMTGDGSHGFVRILARSAVPLSPDLHELDTWGEHARASKTILVLFQISLLVAGAKLLGWGAERIRMPGVVGELMAGVLIGPYVLGGLIRIPLYGAWVSVFPAVGHVGEWPVSPVVWALAEFASIILLFITGLNTDFAQFLRYLRPASFVAVVGMLAPFALGAGITVIPTFAALAMGNGETNALIPALFVGAIMSATSIGITARVLGDIGKIDTPEGVTILGAAVLDDVLCVILLAIVGGIASSHSVAAGSILGVAGKALGFWVGMTALALACAGHLKRR